VNDPWKSRLACKGQDDHALSRSHTLAVRGAAAFRLIFGAFRSSSEFRPKRIGGGIIRDDAPLTGNPAFECLADLGGILLGDRASCQDDCQNAEKKSHRSHTTYNKKADP
jgi:hypothetical protein